jgi:hypothetical protein
LWRRWEFPLLLAPRVTHHFSGEECKVL